MEILVAAGPGRDGEAEMVGHRRESRLLRPEELHGDRAVPVRERHQAGRPTVGGEPGPCRTPLAANVFSPPNLPDPLSASRRPRWAGTPANRFSVPWMVPSKP